MLCVLSIMKISMKKKYLLCLVLISITTIICVSGEPECMVACTPEKNAECQTQVFPAIYDPSFCGLMPDGQWRNYTFECQACNAGAIAVDEGACTCEKVPCDDGLTCIDHECVPIVDPCYPDVSSPAGCILSCEDPYFDDCATTFSFIYAPSFCAWTQSGTWVNYTFDCQACLHPEVLGLLEGPCSCSNMVCPGHQACIEGTCVNLPDNCSQDQQCGKNADCIDGKCVEVALPCKYRRCGKDFLFQDGRCVYKPQGKNHPCNRVKCPSGEVCENRKCIKWEEGEICPDDLACQHGRCPHPDPCFLIKCQKGFQCLSGYCQPIKIYTADSIEDGKCVYDAARKRNDPCQDVVCPKGKVCHEGECIVHIQLDEIIITPADPITIQLDPIIITNDKVNRYLDPITITNKPAGCVDGQILQNRICVADPCKNVRCSRGQECRNGKCVGSFQFSRAFSMLSSSAQQVCIRDRDCPALNVCVDGSCQQKVCQVDEDCKYSWQTCLEGVCTDRCALMKCSGCKYGVCGYGQPSEHCAYDLDCSNSAHSCASNLCVDECLFTPRCPSGRSCWKGHCLPLQ